MRAKPANSLSTISMPASTPVALYAQPEIIAEKVKTILHKYGAGSGHVFNLGHGILPDINPDHVKAMVDAVHEYSPVYHQ